ncbi:putative efflux pump antibiotic resistance protein [Hypoxylon sp. FL0543]|nr:putative efflux pump antibiotic resistance protein [Hypoxylon sp. FL0543]
MSSTTELAAGPAPAAGDNDVSQKEKATDNDTQLLASDSEATKVKREVTGIRWFIVVVAVLSSTFLYALDNTVTANVRPSIVETFGRTDVLTWLSVSYPMGEVGSNPVWGKLNKQFNNKLLYLAALLIFEVGSAVIGSAQSVEAVIIGRAVAGVGGSGIYVGTVNIISAMTIATERNQYLGFVGMTWALGTIIGPIVGGAFADSSATWRWAFYINIVIAALAAPACITLIPKIVPPTSDTLFTRVKRIDYVGAVLFLGGVVAIIIILGCGGSIYAWDSGQMVGLYAATPIIWAAFGLQQRLSLFTVDRLFPVQFVGDWEMVNLFSWTSIAIANVVVSIYTLPLFFQFTYGDSALRAAVWTLPFIGAAVVSCGVSGPVFPKFSIYMPWFTASAAVMLVGAGLLTTIDYNTSRGAIAGFTVIEGFGCGPVIQLGYTVGQAKAPRTALPEVTAFLTCAQMAGLALSLGIATTIFLNGATHDISIILPDLPRDFIEASINGAKTTLLEDLSPELCLRVLEAIASTTGKVFYLNVAGAALGFLTSLMMKRERLQLETN